ncbi:MAG TPA: type II toxin-antitoxin system death-on-curing family toxin [Longimicrobiaceae bacterium]|nr:type II toxin-antitoxin system death-on-curing family toxin [Longimicrobiaceae bacterium]
MTEPVWLRRAWVDALHFQQLKRFGGLYGVRDEGVIESALARPLNRWEYTEERDLAALGAAYGYGLTRSHGYSDGNKRVGFVAMAVFLEINGRHLEAPQAEVVQMMLGVAAGEVDEPELAAWVLQHLQAGMQEQG